MYGALPSAFRSRLIRRMRSAPSGSLVEEAGLGGAASTPVAAYREVLPYVAMTVLPLMAAMRYQVEPDLAVGHVAFQLPPETVPATVNVALAARVVLTDEVVEVPERMFMALQAGTIVDAVAALAAGTPTDNAPRSAATAVRTRGARRVCRATRIWCGVLRSNMGDEPSTQTVGRPTTQRSHIP